MARGDSLKVQTRRSGAVTAAREGNAYTETYDSGHLVFCVDPEGNFIPLPALLDGRLNVEQTSLYTIQVQILKELKKMNLILAEAYEIEPEDDDIEV